MGIARSLLLDAAPCHIKNHGRITLVLFERDASHLPSAFGTHLGGASEKALASLGFNR
jgi:hypothetical protein